MTLKQENPVGRPRLNPTRKRSRQLVVMVSEVEMLYIDRLRRKRSRSAWGHAAVLEALRRELAS